MSSIVLLDTGIRALKPERNAIAIGYGARTISSGYKIKIGDIVMSDARPKGFVGGRTSDDPAATCVMIAIQNPKGRHFDCSLKKICTFERFDLAMHKALKMAKAQQ